MERIRPSGNRPNPIDLRPIDPMEILRTSLSGRFDIATSHRWVSWLHRRKARSSKVVDFEQVLREITNINNVESADEFSATYALLSYAGEYWLSHTSDFAKEKTRTWHLWCRLLSGEDAFACAPWTIDEWSRRDQKVIQWAMQNCHYALLTYIESSTRGLDVKQRRSLLFDCARRGESDSVEIMIEFGKARREDLSLALRAAVRGGHFDIVERLLEAGADANTPSDEADGQTPLQVAAKEGHLDIVKRLLAAGAAVNAPPAIPDGRTALQAAEEEGHKEVVEVLRREMEGRRKRRRREK